MPWPQNKKQNRIHYTIHTYDIALTDLTAVVQNKTTRIQRERPAPMPCQHDTILCVCHIVPPRKEHS